MYAKNRIGVIVPILNDREIRDTISSIPHYVDKIYILGGWIDEKDFGSRVQSELHGNPRVRYVKNGHGDSRDIGFNVACKRALDDGMDIVAVVASDQKVNPTFLSQLLDPIVWGQADVTRGQHMPMQSLRTEHRGMGETFSTYRDSVQHSRVLDNNLRQIDPFRGNVAFSRAALARLYDHFALLGKRRLLAAIPCYNEEVSIGSVVLKTHKYVDEVLVVDDGSKDTTAKVARDAGARVVSLPKNQGKANGVLTAVKYALDNAFDFLVILDGDGQHDPDELPRIISPVLDGRADLVIGSRFLNEVDAIPFYRRIGQTILTWMTNANSAVKITDSQSGYRVLSKRAMEALDIQSEDYNIESDMITHLSKQDMVIREVPIKAIYEVPHKHKKNPFFHGYDIMAKVVGELGYKRPLLIFGLTGFSFVFIGLIGGFFAIQYYLHWNRLPFVPALFSGICLVLGLILVTSGLILNSLVWSRKSKNAG